MQGRHKGRLVAFTGGSSGLGQAMVQRLSAEGAQVAILDIGDSSETLALCKAGPGKVTAYRCDIGEADQVARVADQIRAERGDPAILVHCAALQIRRSFEQITIDEWRAVQRVNVDGAFLLVRAFLPALRKAGWGRIAIVASSSFFAPPPLGMTHYITSKGALLGFVRGLANEVGGDGITVNALAPGLTRTVHAIANVPQSHFDYVITRQAVKRNGEPEDQAAALSFMISDDAAFMSGQTMLVDGGEGHV
jgi:NAD(P)-dependent dehydrogenase (short-subunit alcohol dehydrogenase family)